MIVFDLILATRRPQMTGIERYGVLLFQAMRQQHPDTVAYVSDASGFSDKTGLIEVSHALSGWLRLPLTLSSGRKSISALICPSFPASPLFRLTRHKLLRVIHDAFPWTQGLGMTLQGKIMFRGIENMMMTRNDFVCAPTKQAASDLLNVFKNTNIICCGNAPGLDFANVEEEEVSTLNGKRYVLSVGTIEPRKNYEKVIGIANAIADKDLTFVIAGRPGWGEASDRLKAAEQSASTNIIWLRNASDGQVLWLHRHAALFLTASHAEGFNMPLVEAGMCGTPILCSDIPIHRDVAPHWASFFPPNLADREAAAALRSTTKRGSEGEATAYRMRYSWDQIATRIGEIIHV